MVAIGEVIPPGEERAAQTTALAPRLDGIHTLPIEVGHPLWNAAKAVAEFAAHAKAPNTNAAYESDWSHFVAWCEDRGVPSMPSTPAVVAHYIAELAVGGWRGEAKRKISTIERRLAAINAKHKQQRQFLPASQKYPQISEVIQGIAKTRGRAQDSKRPIRVDQIRKMLEADGGNPVAAARDKVILLLGFAGAFRRSELAAIDLEHILRHKTGLTIKIPKSKTDQEMLGREVEIVYGSSWETCPVRAIENWQTAGNLGDTGPLLRRVDRYGCVHGRLTPHGINAIIKTLIERVGDPRIIDLKHYSAHSLRAGFVTTSDEHGTKDRQIMRQTGHRSRTMIDRYSRNEQRDREAAAKNLRL